MTLQDSFAAACCQVLRERRQSLGFSQEEVAKRSGLARSYVCDVERGARHPSMRNLSILSAALEISVSDLMANAELALLSQVNLEDLRNKTVKSGEQEIIDYLNNVRHAILVADRERLIFSNKVAREISGHNGHELRSPCDTWCFAQDGVSRFTDHENPVLRALRGESVEGVEVVFKNEHVPEGRRAAVTARPLKGSDGTPTGVVLVKAAI